MGFGQMFDPFTSDSTFPSVIIYLPIPIYFKLGKSIFTKHLTPALPIKLTPELKMIDLKIVL